MKHLNRVFTLLILVSASLSYTGCKDDDKSQSTEETQLNKLKFDWTLSSASDGTDRTAEYPGMKLTISGDFSQEGGTYQYTSSATSWPSVSPWKKADSWKFQSGAETSTIIRQSDVQTMNYTLTNSEKTLTISFLYPENAPGFNNGRTASVAGNWTFVFTRP